MPNVDVKILAAMHNQPEDYVHYVLAKHNITELPRVRFVGDGLEAFYSDLTALACDDPSLAQQQFKEESDINYIVDQFMRTGTFPAAASPEHFGDFTGISDYHSALNAVNQANEAFLELPAKVRSRFQNDPQQLLAFLADENNREEAVKLGLIDQDKGLSTPPPDRASTSQAGGGVGNPAASDGGNATP